MENTDDCGMNGSDERPWDPIEKPPLGVRPKRFFEEDLAFMKLDRVRELLDAVKRFSSARKPIPGDWLVEIRQLTVEACNVFVSVE